MPSAAFLAAASAAVREPVVVMAVESINAVKVECTTGPDWAAPKAYSNVNWLTEVGTVFHETDNKEMYSGEYVDFWEHNYPFAADSETNDPNVGYSATQQTPDACAVYIATYVDFSNSFQGSPSFITVTLQTSPDNTTWTDGSSFSYRSTENPWLERGFVNAAVAKGHYYYRVKIETDVGYPYAFGAWTITEIRHETRYLTNASIQTKSLDLGVVPSSNSIIQMDDTIPNGCSISYTARGSANNSSWTNLGTVVDGSSIAPYRYYDVTATMVSNGIDTPRITEIRILSGDALYDYYSTRKDQPVQGAKPYIIENSLSSLTSKIDPMKQPTTGEVGVKLAWTKKTSDMIAEGYLKNKTVAIKIGFDGLAINEYEPYFTGTWFDHTDDHEKMEINVKTRDVWKQFKTKIPEETYFTDANGTKIEGKVYALAGNIIDVIIAVLDASGVPDRYINRTEIAALEAAHFTGADWNVSRDLTESTEVDKLLTGLAVSAGLLSVITPDGKYTLRHYDTVVAAADPVVLDARSIQFSAIEGGQKELFTRQAIYYQLISGKEGGSKDDYSKGYIHTNAPAEIAWGESYTKEWLDQWGVSAAALERLADRMDSWFSYPRYTVRAENIPPRYIGLNTGDLVSVDWLRLPAATGNWPGFSSAVKFLIVGKSISLKDLSIAFDLVQVSDVTYQTGGIPTYTKWGMFPPVTGLTLTEVARSRSNGVSIEHGINVTFTQPADYRYGGAQIWLKTGTGNWAYYSTVSLGGPNTTRTVWIPGQYGISYSVAVLTVNTAQLLMALADAPTATVLLDGVPDLTPPTGIGTDGNTVIWTPPTDVNLFTMEVWRSSDNNINNATLLTTVFSSSWSDATAVSGNTYHYWVRSKGINGEWSTYTGPVSITYTAPGAPAAPTTPTFTATNVTMVSALNADGIPISSAELSWSSVTNADSYQIRYKVAAESNYSYVTVANIVTTTTTVIKNLLPGVSYHWSIRAFNTTSSSAWSTEFAKTTAVDTVAPAVPTNLTLTQGVLTVIAKWDVVADQDLRKYVMEVDTDNAFTTGHPTSYEANATMASFKITIGTAYYVRVKAVDASGNSSAWSTTATITPAKVSGNSIITADSITTSSLSAVSSDLGTITAGTITMNVSGSHIKGGQTAYNDGVGFWIGNDGGGYKFSIGNPSANYFSFSSTDGSMIMNMGTADNVFKVTSYGIHLGNAAFASAPFSVSMAGALIATSATIKGFIKTADSGTRIEINNADNNRLIAYNGTTEIASIGTVSASHGILRISGGSSVPIVTEASTALAVINSVNTSTGPAIEADSTAGSGIVVRGASPSTVTGGLKVTGGIRVNAMETAPANAGATGTLGEIRITATYIYVCTATNTWKRALISTW